MKNQRNHARHHVGLILALIGLVCGVTLITGPPRLASAQAVAPSWGFTGSLNTTRAAHTATLLTNGKVLVAGGYEGPRNSSELYDPATRTWSGTGNLNEARAAHTSTLLNNGKVLVAGGHNGSALNSAELYDPATGTWARTGNLITTREEHTATLLSNDKVLVAGGVNNSGGLSGAELYDPATGRWSSTGNLKVARHQHTATLLPNGKVLFTGGSGDISAELYDPITETTSYTGFLHTARFTSTATLLSNGKVLVAGGFGDITAELYDPATGVWSITGNLNASRGFSTATILSNGKVLVAGGLDNNGAINTSAELYDATTENWSNTAGLNTGRVSHTATLLPDGKVLVGGGSGDNTAELYDPGTNSINQIDLVQFFVRQHYGDFLNREPDADGFAFWTNEINLCGGDVQCVEVKRINVSASFFLSIEFHETGYLVYRFYKASYGNLLGAPVPLTHSEFLPDMQQIGHGVIVNQAGWEQVLESNKQTFASQFVQRARFASVYPTSLRPAQFVDALFANAAVVPSTTERDAAINEFGASNTTDDLAARARALRRVAENPILTQQEFNRAFVLMQYFGYLRRNPNDPPEATLDFQGYNFWLTKLNQFNGNFVQAEMVKAFITSSEYRQRFAP